MSGPSDERVEAAWSISLDLYCPRCGQYVDLLEGDDFWCGRKFEIGEHGTERTKNVEVSCPECKEEFDVDLTY